MTSEFMQKVNALPKDGGFAFRVCQLMEQENLKDLQKLQIEDGERYKQRCKNWPEYKQRICPQCRHKKKIVQMHRSFHPTVPYGGAIEYRCSTCKYCERLA